MVSGERVCVPRKNQIALEVRWDVPTLFASNHQPDYTDNAGQVGRRMVPFKFGRPVAEPDPDAFAAAAHPRGRAARAGGTGDGGVPGRRA
jgi:hypothetical protein